MHLKNLLRASFLVTLRTRAHGQCANPEGVQGVWNPPGKQQVL